MARSKFGYNADSFRIVHIVPTSPAYTPATGTNRAVVITVPDGAIWEVMLIRDNYTATAAVGTRQNLIFVQDTALNFMYLRVHPITFGASSALTVHAYPGTVDSTVGVVNTATMSLPTLVVPEKYVFGFNLLSGVDAADTHTVSMLVKEYC